VEFERQIHGQERNGRTERKDKPAFAVLAIFAFIPFFS
jgi:hypothetical protein